MSHRPARVLESNLVATVSIVLAVAFAIYIGAHVAAMFAGIAAELDVLRSATSGG